MPLHACENDTEYYIKYFTSADYAERTGSYKQYAVKKDYLT